MKLKPTTKIKRNKETMFKEIEEVVYILDPRNATIYTLNKTASFIWKNLEKPLSIEKIISLVYDRFEVKIEKVRKDVMRFVSKYLKEEFVQKA